MNWIKLNSDDVNTFPQTDDYILLSFSNHSLPVIGRCEGNVDDGYTFYAGDDEENLASIGLFVNGWMPLPKCLVESKGV